MMKLKWLLVPLVLQLLALGGCATTAGKADLVPSNVATYASTGKTVYVAPVTVRPQPKPGFLMNEPPRLDSETFRNAIVGTLRRTGLFSDIKTNGAADYTLTADIVGQRILGGASNVGLLLVNYRLTAPDDNKVIWSGNLFSHFEATAGETFYGGERVRLLLERLARDNMSRLGKKMGDML